MFNIQNERFSIFYEYARKSVVIRTRLRNSYVMVETTVIFISFDMLWR